MSANYAGGNMNNKMVPQSTALAHFFVSELMSISINQNVESNISISFEKV